MPLTVLLPVFATEVLRGGPRRWASDRGDGPRALLGALVLASRKSVLGLGGRSSGPAAPLRTEPDRLFVFRVLWLSMLLLAVAGFAVMMEMAASNTILQTIVDDDKRGRVMSFYTMSFLGVAPLGSLLAGSLASRIGAPHVVQLGGLTCVAAALIFSSRLPAIRRLIRPIYQRIGVLPDMTAGIPAVAEVTVEEEAG